MKCPICNNPRIRYNTKLTKTKTREGKKLSVRTDYTVTCSKCGYHGEVKPLIYTNRETLISNETNNINMDKEMNKQ